MGEALDTIKRPCSVRCPGHFIWGFNLLSTDEIPFRINSVLMTLTAIIIIIITCLIIIITITLWRLEAVSALSLTWTLANPVFVFNFSFQPSGSILSRAIKNKNKITDL